MLWWILEWQVSVFYYHLLDFCHSVIGLIMYLFMGKPICWCKIYNNKKYIWIRGKTGSQKIKFIKDLANILIGFFSWQYNLEHSKIRVKKRKLIKVINKLDRFHN